MPAYQANRARPRSRPACNKKLVTDAPKFLIVPRSDQLTEVRHEFWGGLESPAPCSLGLKATQRHP